jgi:hypothetical protein
MDLQRYAAVELQLHTFLTSWDFRSRRRIWRWLSIGMLRRVVSQILRFWEWRWLVVEIDECFRGTYCLHHQGDESFLLLTSVQCGGEWSASCIGCSIPGERFAGTHWLEGWVRPRAGLNVWGGEGGWDEDKNRCPKEKQNSIFQSVASRYAECAVPAHGELDCRVLLFEEGWINHIQF